MTINGVEFDIDFTDADVVEKVDIAHKEFEKKVDELIKNKDTTNPVEGIRQECRIYKDFIDYVLGDGASEMIFKGKDSLNLCINAFEDIFNSVEQQHNSMFERISKYSPERLKR